MDDTFDSGRHQGCLDHGGKHKTDWTPFWIAFEDNDKRANVNRKKLAFICNMTWW
jgi:hypothetical protein